MLLINARESCVTSVHFKILSYDFKLSKQAQPAQP